MTFSPRTETYVNVSSLSDPYNITVTKPTGTVDGDILFCWIGWYAAVTIDSVPSGWALLGEYLVNTDRYALYWKKASGEGASWIWSFTATAPVRAVCSCYYGDAYDKSISNPIDVVSNTAYRTSDVNCRAASMTVAVAKSPLVFWGGVYSTSSKTFTKPSVPTTGWAEDDDAGSTTPDFWTEVCSMVWGSSGATGIMSATISATLTAKHAFAVALKPPVAKAFADVGGGVEGFINPFRAMGFGETGHGTEAFNNPFRAMRFSDVGAGTDVFTQGNLTADFTRLYFDSSSQSTLHFHCPDCGEADHAQRYWFNKDRGSGTMYYAIPTHVNVATGQQCVGGGKTIKLQVSTLSLSRPDGLL